MKESKSIISEGKLLNTETGECVMVNQKPLRESTFSKKRAKLGHHLSIIYEESETEVDERYSYSSNILNQLRASRRSSSTRQQ